MSSEKEAKALEAKNLGNAALAKKDYDTAIKYFSAGLTYTPNNHVLFSNRSAAQAAAGNFEEALKDANEAIRCKPDWFKGYSRKGLALYNLKRPEESVAAYKKAVELDPSNEGNKDALKKAEGALKAAEFTVLGEEFLNKKKYQAANDHFQKAVDLVPTSKLYQSNLSHAQTLLGRYADALKSADAAVAIAPEWFRGYQRKAEAFAANRDYQSALPWFARAVQLAPDNEPLSRAFSQCQTESINAQRRAAYEEQQKKRKKDSKSDDKNKKSDENNEKAAKPSETAQK